MAILQQTDASGRTEQEEVITPCSSLSDPSTVRTYSVVTTPTPPLLPNLALPRPPILAPPYAPSQTHIQI